MNKITRVYSRNSESRYALRCTIEGEMLPFLPEGAIFYFANEDRDYTIKNCAIGYDTETNTAVMEYYIW